MFTRIFTSIKVVSALGFCLILTSCHNTSPSAKPEEAEQEQKKEGSADSKKQADRSAPQLTNQNAATFLRNYGQKHPENRFVIHTNFGDITIRLYENTPLHRANMVFLTHQNYFDGTWFYRVSEGHVIQAGSNDERQTIDKREKIGHYTIPAEKLNTNIHKYGAVAAARSYKGNAAKRSDPYEFYITLGDNYSTGQLKAMEEEYDMNLSERQIQVYSSRGGAPHLDGQHTVFGEVIEGMSVVEEISRVKVDEGEWPLKNIPITVEVK